MGFLDLTHTNVCMLGTNLSQTAPKDETPKKADLSCGNQGLAYAIYPNKRPDGTNVPWTEEYTDFDPTIFKTAVPQVTGKTKTIGTPDTKSIYGITPTDWEYVVVNHRGFFFAEQSGEYTFTMPSCDNFVLLWTGSKAFTDYTRANADLVQKYVQTGGQPVVYKQTLNQGQYYPMRILFANAGGPGNFQFSIKAPDGKVVFDDKITNSPAFVQFSCDGVTAPKFPAFGAEIAAPMSLGVTETCPGLDKQFRTADGRLYKIFCGAYTTGYTVIWSDKRSLVDCLKACTAEKQCNSIDYAGPGTASRISLIESILLT